MKEKYVCNWCRMPILGPGFCPVCLKKVKALEHHYVWFANYRNREETQQNGQVCAVRCSIINQA